MPVIPAGGGKNIKSSASSLDTKQVWGHPRLYKTVSGKQTIPYALDGGCKAICILSDSVCWLTCSNLCLTTGCWNLLLLGHLGCFSDSPTKYV